MTLYDIHLANIKRLIDEFGSVRAVSDLADCSEHHLREVVKGSLLPSGSPKGIGKRLARKIEQGTGKPAGWLDVCHSEPPRNQETISLEPDEQIILVRYRRAPAAVRRIVQLILDLEQSSSR